MWGHWATVTSLVLSIYRYFEADVSRDGYLLLPVEEIYGSNIAWREIILHLHYDELIQSIFCGEDG
jgi:hypothetical protein